MTSLVSGSRILPGGQAVDPYYTTVTGRSGLVAYWRLSETTTLRDDGPNALHGTFSGTVVLDSDLPGESSDSAVNFGGVGTGARAHNAAFDLSAFTLSLWFRFHVMPVEPLPEPIFSKESDGGFVDGDTTIYLTDEGSLHVRMQQGGESYSVVATQAVTLETTHHVALRADNTGFDAYLNGVYLGKNVNVTDAWNNNVEAIGFAVSPPFLTEGVLRKANITMDEVALYNRVLTQSEILELAQEDLPGQLPTANNDNFSVPESANTTLDVVDNDTFVGSKAGLTVAIVAQPGGGDSVAVDGSNNITYTSGAVTGDQSRSFTYRITDPNGQSNVATVSVIVTDTVAPTSNANCFVESSSNTVVVSSIAALANAVNAAPAGRQILIAPGSYSGSMTLDRDGTQANPIVIRPQNGIGTVTITGGTWTLEPTSSWIVISKLYFTAARIHLQGNHNRVTRCRWRDFSVGVQTEPGGNRDCRIDHCDFANALVSEGGGAINLRSAATYGSGTSARLLIDYCYFHNWTGTTRARAVNNFGVVPTGANAPNGSITFDHCLFQDLDIGGEFVVNKTGGMIYQFCTFNNVDGYFQWREGAHQELRSCWFEATQSPHCFSEDTLCIGNRFIGSINCWVPSGNGSWTNQQNGSLPPNRYEPATNSKFISNRFGSGHLLLGEFWGNPPSPNAFLPANNNDVEANTRDSGGNAWQAVNSPVNPGHTNTSFSSTPSMSSTPAVKLAPSNVGLAAPDPLCPSGPQS